ncbi:xanthine dehydrogenase family protein molybdopterin-binding subunit [Pseudofrankia inefficax]|uniref:Aldehyde oxidase and xanthine dehydrogenase molybdopterin binding protein n=1 Tax=Pseudofrankia inefficax (strain DSM 45817 / CECT 9037 / DDB 130130 / EuI1c) TaxID=298654 RepID=E3J6K1_PSEI1|nr:xanthine dehydrogenase family protein molybdopterin-binding subunit [Pseudofrankia inefficax]ADP80777.1 aldehyde oxidase and xanthine dehydrogenase molybdopterin binding protein [Pseudofrankia inefficax]
MTGSVHTATAVSAAARYAGARVRRVEDPRLLTGQGTFVDDVVRPRMVHACFVRSPFPRARILGIDASAALALDGVHAVFVAADLNPDVHEAWYGILGKNVPDTPRPPLAEDEVRFVGDPVALVIAENRYVAEDAVDLVEVDYDPLPAVADYAGAQETDELVHEAYPNNLAGGFRGSPVDAVDAACASAAHVVAETFFQQAYAPVPMETRGIVVEWAGGELTIWVASQAPHEVRAFAARLLGLPENRVRAIMRDTGGGFGQKVNPMREDMCIMLAARKVPGAIKWIEDRRENLMAANQARHAHGYTRFAFDEDARIVAAQIEYTQDVGAYPTPWPVGTSAAVGMLFPGPYRIPTATWSTWSVFSNTVGLSAYRGPWQFESVAREVLLDIAARRLGLDPADLRRRNFLANADMPYQNPAGFLYNHLSPREVFEAGLAKLDYDAFRREQAAAREQGRYLGVGTASYVEPTASAMGFYATEGATIRIEPSGKVNVYLAGGSTGNSLETTAVQLTADALGVDLADVNTIQGDTAVTPFGGGTGGSRSGSMIAGAVQETGAQLRERIIAIAAHLLEAPAENIELARGRATVQGDPSPGLSVAEIAAVAYFEPDKLPKEVPPGLEASGRYQAKDMMQWANATHVCTCEVDIVTGVVTLLRYIVSEDVGPMINPNIVEGQVAGGTVQGIGGALYENLVYDADGNPLATTFLDYLVPTMAEVPLIEIVHLETPGSGPGGYKGAGEGGAIGAPPAIINAVADALAPFGVTITRLPVTPASIVDLLVSARAQSA